MVEYLVLLEQEVHHENTARRLCHEELQTSQVSCVATPALGALKAA